VQVEAVDLQEDLEVGAASMDDYSAAVVNAADGLLRPLALVGWSMGGLVVLMASEQVEPDRVVLLEPSPPGELKGRTPRSRFRREHSTVNPSTARFPRGFLHGPNLRAHPERRRGVYVPSVARPTLVLRGREFRSTEVVN
jgi:pimeloyl-ACP methyl ester carboxylesterase